MPLNKPRRWLVILALAGGGVGWATWRWYEHRYPTWEEEVQLSDGRVIVVKQQREYYDNYGTAQSWLTLSLPELGGERTWHSYLEPMRVDVVEGKVYAFGRPRGDKQVQHYVYPKQYLVAFVWNGTEFVRVPFMSLPTQARSSENIFPCLPPDRSTQLKWPVKEASWCPPSDNKGLLTRKINLSAYVDLANEYARRSGGLPITD